MEPRKGGDERLRAHLVRLRCREQRRLLDPRGLELGEHGAQLVGRRGDVVAEDDRVGAAQDADQRASAAAVLARPRDQPGDLDQLDQDAVDPGQRRHRPRGRERVVAGLDLDARERLQERRLARVRRPDQRDLGRSFAANGDRVPVNDTGARARGVELAVHPLADVRVGAAAVVGEVGEDRPQLADALGSLLADESALDHLHLCSVGHGHCALLLIRAGSARARTPTASSAGRVLSRRFLRRVEREAADQPCLFELPVRQASSGPRPNDVFIGGRA